MKHVKFFWGLLKACVGLDIWPHHKRYCNSRYYERQGMWRGIDLEHQRMEVAFKECFGSELEPHKRYADDPPNPPFPEVE